MKIKFSGADVFKNLAAVLVGDIERRERSALPYSLALSGGESAVKLFEVLSSKKYEYFDWDDVDFFWVDERCVPQRDSESNVGEAKRHFLRGRIKTENIFGIRGWDCPVEEAKRYSKTVRENVRTENGLPRFDCVILGVGEDGHTASIFPQTMKLLDVDEIYDVSWQHAKRRLAGNDDRQDDFKRAQNTLPDIGRKQARNVHAPYRRHRFRTLFHSGRLYFGARKKRRNFHGHQPAGTLI